MPDRIIRDVTKRGPLSKRVRFNVFKRDGFRCQYCGRTPPIVVLEIDHIHPIAKGGNNDSEINLITACYDCNRGKGAELLSTVPQSVQERVEALAEREAQIRAYNRLLRAKKRREDDEINQVEAVFKQQWGAYYLSHDSRESVRNFIAQLGIEAVIWSMHTACWRIREPRDAWKYFCGICWKKVREVEERR